MSSSHDRRAFLKRVAAAGAAVGLADLSFLAGLPPILAADLQPLPDTVRLHAEIEPLVRLLEDTPRNRLLEEVAGRVRGGLTYRELLAAVLLAGVRNVQPRPSVGFKFHAVLVVNSVHLAAMASPETERWLPLFWALDYFKESQARDVQEGNWTMRPVDESAVPPADKARAAFLAAMDRWDESAADAAVAGLARSTPAKDVFELFYRFGARDFRSIGHKAIFVAGAERTLQFIGWRHAEPVLRSLAYALLMHEGENPAERDAEADRPWRQHPAVLKRLSRGLDAAKVDAGATRDLLATLRSESYESAAAKVAEVLNRGVAAQSVWDAIFCGAGELLLRQPGIVALHAVTTTNAMHYAYQASGDPETRKLLLLQNASFLPMFREAMRGRGSVAEAAIDILEPAAAAATGAAAAAEVLATVSRDRRTAARKTLAYFAAGGDAEPLLNAARQVMVLKGDDAHDFKFGAAILEDAAAVSPAWRGRFLAACMLQLNGASEPDSPTVSRTRAALG
jgi:hypothetical protein